MFVFRKGTAVRMAALALATLISVTACEGGCSGKDDAASGQSSAEVIVGTAGAQKTVNNVEVTVPAGAVAKDTKLTVSAPKSLDPKSAPLEGMKGVTSVQFDVSLDDGKVQPAKDKPLTLKIPNTEEFAPKGVDPRAALVYTTLSNGQLALLDSRLEREHLIVTVPHLSPKTITYVTEEGIKEALENGALKEIGGDCKKSGAAPPMKTVKITQDAPNGLVEACITTKKSDTFLTVRNRTPIMWGVKATPGAKVLETNDLVNVQMVKMLRGDLYTGVPQGILARDSYIDIKLNTARIPTKVEVRAHQRLVNAELVVKALQLWVQIKSGNSQAESIQKTKKLLVELPGLEECLAKVAGDTALTDAFGLLFSTCGDLIGKGIIKVLGDEAASWVIPKKWWDRVQLGGGAIVDGWNLFQTQVTTVLAKFDGEKINIVVDEANPCLTEREFSRIGMRLYTSIDNSAFNATSVVSREGIECRDGWALIKDMGVLSESYMNYAVVFGPLLIKKVDGRWQAMGLYASPFDSGTDGPTMIHKTKKGCNKAPDSFRRAVRC